MAHGRAEPAPETVETLVIGAGQAGIAMSEHLSARGLPHLVVERARIAERWRSGRWDSMVANGPAWHDRFPGMDYPDTAPEAFPGKEQVADYFEAYAGRIAAPIRCGVEVTGLRQRAGGAGFRVETSDGVIEARNVVAATGPFQRPVIPDVIPSETGLMQIHSAAYRNPDQLPAGAVLVVGAGASGVQIAEELNRAGRRVYLSVGPHDRPPRRYRGRDFVWWLGVLGKWAARAPDPGTEHVTIAVSGANGGRTIDFRVLAREGITLLGRSQSYAGGCLHLASDLAQNIAAGDANYLSVLAEADAYIRAEGLDLPEEPEAHRIGPMPGCVTDPVLSLDLQEAGIGAVIWATGYALDFGWMDLDIFDEKGRPRHDRGVSDVPGLYFLGLPWLATRGSSFIWGCWQDARHLATEIAARQPAEPA
ncbi:flavin-containing monooxygenase [Szabonella alba]|uniref:NAD(P)-binding domain-containing protein n=1 Tax=Szabonella alba TaxID=2804194 RepID=A0A8K0VBQ5_9RHOB|nr:NAD(P)/FAD-dependent oxidoreductase [Szabonella alba]MBL4918036.1 NAD(P)-binding domain-containing protein [Szabonella alba]